MTAGHWAWKPSHECLSSSGGRIRVEREATGTTPRSQEEIDAYLATMRDEDERSQMIEQIQEECRRQREQNKPTEAK